MSQSKCTFQTNTLREVTRKTITNVPFFETCQKYVKIVQVNGDHKFQRFPIYKMYNYEISSNQTYIFAYLINDTNA